MKSEAAHIPHLVSEDPTEQSIGVSQQHGIDPA
jgi:hypothetical protein